MQIVGGILILVVTIVVFLLVRADIRSRNP